jgi:hypothetical protein
MPLGRKRSAYLSQDIMALLAAGPWPTSKDQERWGYLTYWFDRFTDGARLTLRSEPRPKKSTADMARLEPVADEVWEVRSLDPKPAMRVFGSFAQRDVFVGLAWAWRKNLNGYGGLNGSGLSRLTKALGMIFSAASQ